MDELSTWCAVSTDSRYIIHPSVLKRKYQLCTLHNADQALKACKPLALLPTPCCHYIFHCFVYMCVAADHQDGHCARICLQARQHPAVPRQQDQVPTHAPPGPPLSTRAPQPVQGTQAKRGHDLSSQPGSSGGCSSSSAGSLAGALAAGSSGSRSGGWWLFDQGPTAVAVPVVVRPSVWGGTVGGGEMCSSGCPAGRGVCCFLLL